jgi:hypothetical protein
VLLNCYSLSKRNIKTSKTLFLLFFNQNLLILLLNYFFLIFKYSLKPVLFIYKLKQWKIRVFLAFFSVFRSKSLNILQNQAKRPLLNICLLFKDFKVLGGALKSVPELRYSLLLSFLSIFRPKTTANPPIDNVNDNEKRNSSLNLRSIKMQVSLRIALNFSYIMNLLQLWLNKN